MLDIIYKIIFILSLSWIGFIASTIIMSLGFLLIGAIGQILWFIILKPILYIILFFAGLSEKINKKGSNNDNGNDNNKGDNTLLPT